MTLTGPVLVTGARGFVGTHLVHCLAAEGVEVRAVDIRPLDAAPAPGGVTSHQADLRDLEAMAALLRGVETVFHLASLHLDRGVGEAEFAAVNVRGSADFTALAARHGVRRFVHTSSVGVYGDAGRGDPLGEDAPKRPQNAYERSKLAGELAVLARAREVGLDVVALRPAWVYGPGCPRTAKLLRALRKGRFVYIGDGTNLRHPIHISDMLDAYLCAVEALPRVAGRVYNIGGPEILPLRQVVEVFAKVAEVPAPRFRLPMGPAYAAGWTAEIVFRLLRREPPVARRSLAFFRSNNSWNISAARTDLGFEPAVELEEGIRRTLADWSAASAAAH